MAIMLIIARIGALKLFRHSIRVKCKGLTRNDAFQLTLPVLVHQLQSNSKGECSSSRDSHQQHFTPLIVEALRIFNTPFRSIDAVLKARWIGMDWRETILNAHKH